MIRQSGSRSPDKWNGRIENRTDKTTVSTSRVAYTVKETAAKLAVSTKTVYRWIQRGLLKPISKASRKLLIAAAAVENFIEETK